MYYMYLYAIYWVLEYLKWYNICLFHSLLAVHERFLYMQNFVGRGVILQ